MLCVSFLGVVFMVFVSRKEKNARHFAWLLIALLVFRNLILCVCVIVSVWSSCGISLFFSQIGGAIYSDSGDLTFEGSATFTSCSVEASSESSTSEAVSSGDRLLVEEAQAT